MYFIAELLVVYLSGLITAALTFLTAAASRLLRWATANGGPL